MQGFLRTYPRMIFRNFILVLLTFLFLAVVLVYKRGSDASIKQRNDPIDMRELQPEVHGARQVLLLTYMRSGSSLVGDILQHMPEAFYVYEPLRIFGAHRNSTIRYVNGTTRRPPHDFQAESANILRHWFECSLSKLHQSSLRDGLFLGFGLKTRSYKQCKNSSDVCLNMLQKKCEASPVRLIKTIRMELGAVKGLLDVLPNLKIVHLVRDPRATLRSQEHLGRCTKELGGLFGCANAHCTHLENDVIEEEEIAARYPGRLITTFYENIAMYPLETSKELYNFCGGEFTKNAKEYVYNITMAGQNDTCIICTVRSNSTEHIDSWKTSMPTEFVNIVQEKCNFVLKRYNYQIYHKK